MKKTHVNKILNIKRKQIDYDENDLQIIQPSYHDKSGSLQRKQNGYRHCK